ncbi:hypothetical protein ACNA6I_23100 (plasmid) [Rossellomorea sp. FS2]|uniref:hypothetical protein n=1 Tax=Rossellomorea sp. FS2 TaxID=3391447 RepID=UPI003A4D8716
MDRTQNYKEEIAKKVISLKHELISQKNEARSHKHVPIQHLQNWRENIITIYAASIAEDLDSTYETLEKWGNEAVQRWLMRTSR